VVRLDFLAEGDDVFSSVKSIHARAAALVLVSSLVVPGISYADRAATSAPTREDLSNIHIDNFGRVTPQYYRGAEPEDDEYASLAALGIRMVVDLRGQDVDSEDKLLVERSGMKYTRIPMTTHEPPTPSMIQAFLEFVSDPGNQPVYVHCVGGRHRTGIMTAVYRMAHEAWTAEEALKEMKRYKFGPDFLHPEFKRFVYSYQPGPSAVVGTDDED
jgi:tyrosine-protein phosphatase SIW14